MKITLLCEVNYKLIRYIFKNNFEKLFRKSWYPINQIYPWEIVCYLYVNILKDVFKHSAITAYVPIQNALISSTF